MNVFATLKTVFFGSKFLSTPVPSDGTPRRDLVSALNGLMPLCRTIPGVHLAVDIREGRVEKLVLGKHAIHCGCFLFLHHMLKYDSGTACVSECRVGNRMGEGDQYAGSDECGIYL